MKALFQIKQVEEVFEKFLEGVNNQVLQALQYLGEEFVNRARYQNTYKDRTGNLRASIGYIILKDGELVERNFTGPVKGTAKGEQVAEEVASKYPKGYVLIGVAGMDYAAAVEAKNFDVISGSAPTALEIKSLLDEIKP